MKINVEYDGEWPNLCGGQLIVITTTDTETTRWVFPSACTLSPDHEYGWKIDRWPEMFPDDLKGAVLGAVNAVLEPSCCGGCK